MAEELQDNQQLTPGVVPPNPLSNGVINPALQPADFTLPSADNPSSLGIQGGTGTGNPPGPNQGTPPLSQGTGGDQSLATIDFAKAFKQHIQDAPTYGGDQFKYGKTYSYGSDYMFQNFDRYYNHPKFKQLGFSAWRDNEALYNKNSSGWDDFRRSAGQWGNLFGTGFASAFRSWGDMFSGEPLRPDLVSAQEFEKAMAIGSSTRGGFSGFASNTMLNTGYTFGVMSEVLAEEAALAAATFFTGGGASEVTVPAMFARGAAAIGKLGRMGEAVKGTWQALKNLENINYAKKFWDATRATGRFINPLQNTTSFIKGMRNAEGLSQMARVTGTFGAFYRDVRAVNFALAEGKLEGGTTYRDVHRQLMDEFYQKNGRMPNEAESAQITMAARNAGYATVVANLPTIYYTNRITFDNLFRGFRPLGKSTDEFMSAANTKIGFNAKAAKSGLDPFSFVESNLKTVGKSFLNPKMYAKAGLNYFRGNLSEGLQESLQDVISGTAKEYYLGEYHDPGKQGMDDVLGAVYHNTTAQFSKQGFETFMGGFVMGSMVQPVSAVPGWVSAGYYKFFKPEQYNEYKQQKAEYTKGIVDRLNEVYKDPLRFFAPELTNMGAQHGAATGMNQAEQNDDNKSWQDLKDASVYDHIWTSLSTGTYDVMLERLKSVKDMDPDSIKEAFNVEDGNTVLGNTDGIIERANKIRQSYEYWQQRAPNPYNPKKFAKGTPEYTDEAISHSAWELARKHAVFMNYSFGRTVERMDSIYRDVQSSKPLTKASPNDISLLFDPNTIASEIQLLQSEISGMGSIDDPQGKRMFAQKKEKLEALRDYHDKLNHYEDLLKVTLIADEFKPEGEITAEQVKEGRAQIAAERERSLENLRRSYRTYMRHLAAANQDFAMDGPVNDAFDKIKDFYQLRSDASNLSEAANLLLDPSGFAEHFRRNTRTLREMYNSRREIIEAGIKATLERKETNALLNRLYEKGVIMEVEDIEAFLATGALPEYFYDITNKITIPKGTPRYQEMVQVLMEHEEATGKAEEPAAEPAPDLTPDEQELLTRKDVTPTTPWDELPEALRAELTPLWDKYNKENLDPDMEDFDLERIRQNWLTNPIATDIIDKYNIALKASEPVVRTFIVAPVLRTVKITDDRTLDEMPISELNNILRYLRDKQEASTPDGSVDTSRDIRSLDIQDMEDYISQRRGMAPQSKSYKVLEIIDRIEAMQKAVAGRSDDSQYYIINGKPYNRVTSVIAPIAAEYSGYDEGFSYRSLPIAVKMFLDVTGKNSTVADFMTQFRARSFPEFNERKYTALEDALKQDFTVDTLRTTINELAYDGSRVVGNTLDRIAREFLQDRPVSKPEGMDQNAYDALIEKLNAIRDNMLDKGLTLVTNNIVVYDPELGIAGEIDILAIDNEGEVYIYDIKSSKKANWDVYNDVKSLKSNKIKHQLQVSAYGNLLFNSYGILPKGYGIIPLEVNYDLDGNITSLKGRQTIKLDYMPEVEKVIPRAQEAIPTTTEEGSAEPEPAQPEIISATANITEPVKLPLAIKDMVGKDIIWKGKLGKLVVAEDGTFVLDTGKVLYDITRNKFAAPEGLGVTLPKSEENIFNTTKTETGIYQARFLGDNEGRAEINAVSYRVNRNSFGNIVSLTYQTNQKEILELEKEMQDLKAQIDSRNTARIGLFAEKSFTSDQRDTYIRDTYKLEARMRDISAEVADLKATQKSRTTTNSDLIYALNSLPTWIQKRKGKKQEIEDVDIIRSVSLDSSAVDFADEVLSENYPDELDTFIDKGPSTLTTFDLLKIQLWGEEKIGQLERENQTRLSTQLSELIAQLYNLLNDLENIKLTKDGRISKRQGGKARQVPERKSPAPAQVAPTKRAAKSTQQVTRPQGEITQVPVPLKFDKGDSDLIAEGIKTADFRTQAASGLKVGESGTQTIYSTDEWGRIVPVQLRVTYLGSMNIEQANSALISQAERSALLTPVVTSEGNFVTATGVDTTGLSEDVTLFLDGNRNLHIYTLEVVAERPDVIDIPTEEQKMGIKQVEDTLKVATTLDKLETARELLLEKYSLGLIDAPAQAIKALIQKKKAELMSQVSISTLKKGEVIILKDGNFPDVKDRLYTITRVTSKSINVRKLNTTGKPITIPAGDFSSRIEGRWTKDMTQTSTTPEPTPEETKLINQSSDSATQFLSDRTKLQQIADEVEKSPDRDATMGKLLNNLDC